MWGDCKLRSVDEWMGDHSLECEPPVPTIFSPLQIHLFAYATAPHAAVHKPNTLSDPNWLRPPPISHRTVYPAVT